MLETTALPTEPRPLPTNVESYHYQVESQKCEIEWTLINLPILLKSSLYSVTSKKLPNVYKSCPKLISLEKWKILTPLQKLPKNVWDLSKLIVATGFEKLPKVQ